MCVSVCVYKILYPTFMTVHYGGSRFYFLFAKILTLRESKDFKNLGAVPGWGKIVRPQKKARSPHGVSLTLDRKVTPDQ